MQLEDGSLAGSLEQATQRWVRHFSGIEGGTECSEFQLLEDRKARVLRMQTETVEIGPGEVPSRIELEKAMQLITANKACGPDLIPGELLKHGSGCLSKALYQLLLKLAIRRDEPVLFKGGTQYHLWKGSGSPSACENHRAILVSSVMGKALHAVIRQRCVPSFCNAAPPLQVGGRPKFPVSYAAHVVRLHQSIHLGKSSFLLFLDLKDAFYRVVRPLLTDEVPTDSNIAAIFMALNLPQASFQAFREHVCSESIVAKSGGSEWLQGILAETLEGTWFKVPHQQTVVCTSRGTRPGDCLADILFAYVFTEVLHATRSAFSGFPDYIRLPWSPDMRGCVQGLPTLEHAAHLDVQDVTWMDDLCVVAAFPSAEGLLQTFRGIAGRLLDACLERGMQPNLKSNKIEAVLNMSGKDARKLRATFLSDVDPALSVSSAFWPGVQAEVRARAAQAWKAFQKHRRTVFAHPQIDVADKVSLFRTLVLSTLFHASGTWPVISAKAAAMLQRTYLNMARSMLVKHYRGDTLHLCQDRVLALLRLPSVQIWLHFHRLSYLASFMVLDEPTVWALAHAEKRWLQSVRESLEWLWVQVDGGSRTQSWEQAWQVWRHDILHKPRAWKNLIRFARESATRGEVLSEGWQQCRGLLLKRLLRAGGIVTAWRDVFQDAACACGLCQKVFATRQAWAVHAFKVHGRVTLARRLVQGEQCPVCLKTYPTHMQLCHHLQGSSYCRHRLQARGFHCQPLPYGINSVGVVRQGFGPVLPDDGTGEPAAVTSVDSVTRQAPRGALERFAEVSHVHLCLRLIGGLCARSV